MKSYISIEKEKIEKNDVIFIYKDRYIVKTGRTEEECEKLLNDFNDNNNINKNGYFFLNNPKMNKNELIEKIMKEIDKPIMCNPITYVPSDRIRQILQDTLPSEQVVEIRSYYVVDTMGEDIEQISVGFDTYEEALKFLKADAIQKTYPTAYIIGRVKK